MKILRNPELKRELIAYAVITAILSAAGFFVGPLCGLLLLLAGLLFSLAHILFSVRRYRELEELSRSVSRILHGSSSVSIDDSREGELAILRSEIAKMTVKLSEQTDALRQDKIHLTEAIEDIFHQLRTPLTAMNLTVTLLQERELDTRRRLELTRELLAELSRIQWLVESLLKLSRIDAGTVRFRRETVSLAELCRAASESFRIPMELRGQTLDILEDGGSFTGDPAWTAEAISNLLKNAMEHTPDGGTIRMDCSETPIYTQIMVTDTGCGFDPSDIPHLFERFYKGKNQTEGSIGIGLALTRSIVAAQNGTITASNAPGGGARFTVKFYKTVT